MKTKSIYRRYAVLLLAVLVQTLLFSCERIKDNMDDCGVYLEFVYDRNMEYADAFSEQIDGVDIYVFDERDRFLFGRHANGSELIGGNRMFVGGDLRFGRYKVMAVGGMNDGFKVTGTDGKELVPDKSFLSDMRISLNRETAVVSRDFPAIWVAAPVEIDYKADLTVYPVSFVKNTNRFTMVLLKHGESRRTYSPNAEYSFIISATDGAVYGFDNLPRSSERVTYAPYSLEPGEKPEEVSKGKVSANRLIDNRNYEYKLSINDTGSGSLLWEYDLIELLSYLKPETRPDGSILPMQEFLDRQSEWPLILLYREVEGGEELEFGISVGSWIIWLNDIEV